MIDGVVVDTSVLSLLFDLHPNRWIAATAMHHHADLVSHDRIFVGVPGLGLLSALDL